MTPETISLLLTVLAGVVVVLTRLRLRAERAAGKPTLAPWLGAVHTLAGLAAVGLWGTMLATGESRYGWIALPLWWVTALVGLLVLLQWLPGRGRHAAPNTEQSWGEGPGLPIFAHGGVLVSVVLFTVFLVLGEVPA